MFAVVSLLCGSACGDDVSTPTGSTVSTGVTSAGGSSTSVMSSASSSLAGPGGGGGSVVHCDNAKIDGILSLSPDLDNGEVMFGKSCGKGTCHGTDGVSGNGPDFANVLTKYDDCGLLGVMLNGKKGMISLTLIYMSDQDFRDAFTYVRETFSF